MHLYCCYTPAHSVLYHEIFLPSVPVGFEVHPTEIEIEGSGDFLSVEFLECIRQKLDLVCTSIQEHDGEIIVWSDVDIRFFDTDPSELEALVEDYDILFQRESPKLPDVNTGFFVCRCSPATRTFFERVRTGLLERTGVNEQMEINRILQGDVDEKAAIHWAFLPATYYARTHGWPPPRHLSIYHANYTKGKDAIGQKLAQFREMAAITRWGWPAWGWSILRRMPAKFLGRHV